MGWEYGGGLVEVEGRIIWGLGVGGGAYWLDETGQWKKLAVLS